MFKAARIQCLKFRDLEKVITIMLYQCKCMNEYLNVELEFVLSNGKQIFTFSSEKWNKFEIYEFMLDFF